MSNDDWRRAWELTLGHTQEATCVHIQRHIIQSPVCMRLKQTDSLCDSHTEMEAFQMWEGAERDRSCPGWLHPPQPYTKHGTKYLESLGKTRGTNASHRGL